MLTKAIVHPALRVAVGLVLQVLHPPIARRAVDRK